MLSIIGFVSKIKIYAYVTASVLLFILGIVSVSQMVKTDAHAMPMGEVVSENRVVASRY